MQAYHIQTNKETNTSEVCNQEFKGLWLIAEKIKNKTVTRIKYLEKFGFDPLGKENQVNSFQYLAQFLQKRYACSVYVQDSKQNPNIKEIILQGNFIQELVLLFVNECKIDIKYITQKLRCRKKKQIMK